VPHFRDTYASTFAHLKEKTVGLFSSGGVTSANTYARLKTEKNTRVHV
jgi:hypothetical protein